MGGDRVYIREPVPAPEALARLKDPFPAAKEKRYVGYAKLGHTTIEAKASLREREVGGKVKHAKAQSGHTRGG